MQRLDPGSLNATANFLWGALGRNDQGPLLQERMQYRYQTADMVEYMEVFYNRQRRHSTIGYEAPLPFEMLTNAKFKVSTVRG